MSYESQYKADREAKKTLGCAEMQTLKASFPDLFTAEKKGLKLVECGGQMVRWHEFQSVIGLKVAKPGSKNMHGMKEYVDSYTVNLNGFMMRVTMRRCNCGKMKEHREGI